MRFGNKVWSGAPGTIARDLGGATQTKAVTIVNDGFIPRDIVPLSEVLVGRQQAWLYANVLMAPIVWIMRTFPDATARVQDITDDQSPDWIKKHPVEQLIRKPNPWYNGASLWQGTSLSYALDGNGYWHKVRNAFGRVVQLWYRPHWRIKPHTEPNSRNFIDWYNYDTGRGITRLNVRDVVHFRFGVDPDDPRLGYSPLRALIHEVMTDQEAGRFSMHVLKNMGIPGIVVSPSISPTGAAFAPQRGELDALKEYLQTEFTADGRGKPLVFGEPTQVSQFGFDPKSLALTEIRNTVEERVCAMLGIPAAVIGFKSGLEQTKVGATMDKLVQLAWKQCLFPMQRALAQQLDEQLLADFTPDYEDRERVAFDVSDAASLQEDATQQAARIVSLVQGGVMKVNQAQAALGLEVDDTQDGYLRPLTVMFQPGNTVPEPMAPPGADTGNATDPSATTNQAKALDDLAALLEQRANGNGHHTNGSHTEDKLDVAA